MSTFGSPMEEKKKGERGISISDDNLRLNNNTNFLIHKKKVSKRQTDQKLIETHQETVAT